MLSRVHVCMHALALARACVKDALTIAYVRECVLVCGKQNTVEPRYLELAYFELPLISK